MREIKYRALDAAAKKWVYGYYIVLDSGYELVECIWELGAERATPINPDTLGQLTGLVDFNGREIYEGDIIHCRYLSYIEFNAVVRFGKYEQDGSAGEYMFSTCFGFYAEAINKDKKDDWGIRIVPEYAETASLSDFDRLEVIGNVFENPELLKENKL